MDIDAIGKHVSGLLAFKERIEAMIAGGPPSDGRSPRDDLDELMSFRRDFEDALPDIRKLITDVSSVVDDLAAVKKQLEPVLAWVAERQSKEAAEKTLDDLANIKAGQQKTA